ncbi:MAG: hypothetical protein ACUZ8H_03840 [Candidatus Anammoxibacter sp.]
MNEQTVNLISELSESLGVATGELLKYYSEWYFANGILYVLLGVAVFMGSKRIKPIENSEDFTIGFIAALRYAGMFFGLLFIAANAPDLFAPEGIAAHRIIMDIRG